MSTDFVPEGFTPPDGLIAEAFVLEPLGPQHNDADHAAWMSSIEHIHASPGFSDDFDDDPDPWPRPMSLEQNLSDLEQHAKDFQDRDGIHVHRARSRGSRRDRLRLPLPVAPRRRGRACPILGAALARRAGRAASHVRSGHGSAAPSGRSSGSTTPRADPPASAALRHRRTRPHPRGRPCGSPRVRTPARCPRSPADRNTVPTPRSMASSTNAEVTAAPRPRRR